MAKAFMIHCFGIFSFVGGDDISDIVANLGHTRGLRDMKRMSMRKRRERDEKRDTDRLTQQLIKVRRHIGPLYLTDPVVSLGVLAILHGWEGC